MLVHEYGLLAGSCTAVLSELACMWDAAPRLFQNSVGMMAREAVIEAAGPGLHEGQA